MSKTILHISHTDIRCDSRILKELDALEALAEYKLAAIGVEADEGASSSPKHLNARISTICLYTRIFKLLPRPLRYALNIAELTFLLFFRGVQLWPAVVHCHDTLVLPAGVLIRAITRCKLVYDAHELESNKNGQSFFLSKATLAIEKASWSCIDLLVSVSSSILDWYSYNIGPIESLLILNSPQINSDRNPSAPAVQSKGYFHNLYNIPEDQLVFVYLGILEPGRGIEIVLEAFSLSPLKAHVVFVGYGRLSSCIQSCSSKYNSIHLHGPVPHDQVVELVTSAHVGLCLIEHISLSDYYCLPNKLFEYSFAGLYVLASDFPEISKVVDRYKLGKCCSLDPLDVHDTIQSLIDHPPQPMNADVSDLSWNTQAEHLVIAYRSLLGQPR
jgi:glycosyltransferase involved in cell wall biosynthesis